MRKIISYLIVLSFGLYWLATLFFTAPDNYLKIQLFKEDQTFHKFFYQKWGFFAPPPQFNERLYCLVLDKKDSSQVKSFELMQPIIKQKVENAPFNNKADILDYILSNSCMSINNQLVTVKERIEYLEKEQKMSDMEKDSIVRHHLEDTPQFQVLKNYIKEVAKKEKLDKEEYLISFMITNTPIPKFVKRNDEQVKTEELLVYRSVPFAI